MPTVEERIHRPANIWRARCLTLFALAALSLAAPLSAKADAATDWNAIALTTAAAVAQSSPQQGRTASITHAANFDAVNAIEPRYAVYAVSPPVSFPASQEAAAVAAGYGVLVRLFPSRKAALDEQ